MDKQDVQIVQAQMLAISKLETNKGQIQGLPKNPRFIRNERYELLKKSIQDFPAMLGYREVVCVEFENKYVVIGGNMRLRALKELGIKEVPCKVLPANTPIEILQEITIKDNNSFGEYDNDALANEWDVEQIVEWGCEVNWDLPTENENEEDYSDKNKEINFDEETKSQIVLEYTAEDFIKVKTALAKIAPTPESAVYQLLFENE